MRTRRIIVTGCAAPYVKPLEPDEEIWTVAFGYQVQKEPPPSRVYFMDPLDSLVDRHGDLRAYDGKNGPKEAAEQLSELPCPVYMPYKDARVHNALEYPINDVMKAFNALYFTSSMAYVMAHAIIEQVSSIKLWGLFSSTMSREYYHQKDCMEFWIGVALGQGISVVKSGESFLMRSSPWVSPMYGYLRYQNEFKANTIVREAIREAIAVDTNPKWFAKPPKFWEDYRTMIKAMVASGAHDPQ